MVVAGSNLEEGTYDLYRTGWKLIVLSPCVKLTIAINCLLRSVIVKDSQPRRVEVLPLDHPVWDTSVFREKRWEDSIGL